MRPRLMGEESSIHYGLLWTNAPQSPTAGATRKFRATGRFNLTSRAKPETDGYVGSRKVFTFSPEKDGDSAESQGCWSGRNRDIAGRLTGTALPTIRAGGGPTAAAAGHVLLVAAWGWWLRDKR